MNKINQEIDELEKELNKKKLCKNNLQLILSYKRIKLIEDYFSTLLRDFTIYDLPDIKNNLNDRDFKSILSKKFEYFLFSDEYINKIPNDIINNIISVCKRIDITPNYFISSWNNELQIKNNSYEGKYEQIHYDFQIQYMRKNIYFHSSTKLKKYKSEDTDLYFLFESEDYGSVNRAYYIDDKEVSDMYWQILEIIEKRFKYLKINRHISETNNNFIAIKDKDDKNNINEHKKYNINEHKKYNILLYFIIDPEYFSKLVPVFKIVNNENNENNE